MKNTDTKLSESLSAELKKVSQESVTPTNDLVEDGLASVKMIRASLKKAKLGDKAAFDSITSELNAIERSLTGVSKIIL